MKKINKKELKAINGGGFVGWLISCVVSGILWDTTSDPTACGAALNDGAHDFLKTK